MRLIAASFAVLVTVAATVPPASATVIDVDGTGVQICRFRAASPDDPLRRWLTAGETTCTEPSAMKYPDGQWNVFARTKTSISVQPLLVDTNRVQPSSLHLDTVAAAVVTVQLPADASGVVYFPKHAAAVPVEARTIVPAGEELWLIVVEKRAPSAVFVIPPIPPGTERTADARTVLPGRALLAWVRVASEDLAVLQKREVDTPLIRAKDQEHSWDAATPPHAADLDGAFVLFPKISNAALQMDLAGRGWLSAHATVPQDKSAVTVLASPIEARLSASLTVNWSTVGDLEALDRSVGECTPTFEGRFELAISSCVAHKAGEPEKEGECRAFRTEPLPPQFTYGTVTVGDVAPGEYRAELRYGKLPRVSAAIKLAPLDRMPLRVHAQYVRAYGSLTRGGEALDDDARIEFPAEGVGFAPRGHDYAAVLIGGYDTDAKIQVFTCRGEHTTVLAEAPCTLKSRCDVDIPDNRLNISVVDTFTHMRVPGAMVRYVVISKSFPPRAVITLNLATHGAGKDSEQGADRGAESDGSTLSLPAVPPDREIRLRASARGYKDRNLDSFSMSKSETKNVEIQLVPVNGTEGRIVSTRRFERAMLYWYTPDGTETEHEEVASDGSFFYEGNHYRNESMVLVSQSHPLWITHAPVVGRRDELKIAYPDQARVRNVEVVFGGVGPRLVTFVGLAIGGQRVPAAALSEHLTLRDLPVVLRGSGPMAIPSIAETAPIDVLRGPSVTYVTNPVTFRDFAPVVVRRLQPLVDTVELQGH